MAPKLTLLEAVGQGQEVAVLAALRLQASWCPLIPLPHYYPSLVLLDSLLTRIPLSSRSQ